MFFLASSAVAEGDELPEKPEILELEEITVTAQKREENLQEVPVSVTSLDGENAAYMRAGGADVSFLAFRIPSLALESSFGRTFPRAYIRGLGNTDFDLNASQPVSIMLDGVVLENPIVKGFPIFDVDRVEVLRGPQGTLFGRNTPAGVIKFESNRPSMREEGYGRATYGQFNFIGLEAAANAPIIDEVMAARISILYETRDDWVDNTFTGEENALEGFEQAAGRFQLLWAPVTEFRALFNVHANSMNASARVFRANIIEPGTDDLVDDFQRDEVSQDGGNSQEVNQLGAALHLEWDVGQRLSLTSVTGYENAKVKSRGDIDGGFGAAFLPTGSGPGVIPFPSESEDSIPQLHQITEELRLATRRWDDFNFQTGIFTFYEELEVTSRSRDSLAGGVQNGYAEQAQDTTSLGAFASGTVALGERVELGAGLRFTHEKKQFSASREQSPIGAGPLAEQEVEDTAKHLSWDASATFTPATDLHLFARMASGFRAPSIQGRLLFGDEITMADSEKILSFEIGLKSELADRRARVNLGTYYYLIDDQQLTAVGGDSNFNTLLNVDETVGYGVEVDAQAVPVRRMFVTVGFSYNHTEIQDGTLAVVPCGAPCTVLDPPGTVMNTVLLEGNPLPHAPSVIANVTLRYGVPVDDAGSEVFAFTDWAYRSKVSFFLYESTEFSEGSMLEGGARLGYSHLAGRIEAAAFVRNMLDDTSRTGGIDFNNLTGFVNEPRFFGVETTFRY